MNALAMEKGSDRRDRMVGRVVARGRDERRMVRALRPPSRSRARAGRGLPVETDARGADLTLEGTGSHRTDEQNDGTNAEIMSRLDVPFWKGWMKRYVAAAWWSLPYVCLSLLLHNIGASVVFWSVCVSVLPARKQLCLDYIRAPSWPRSSPPPWCV